MSSIELSKRIRISTLEMIESSKSSHLASGFSIADLLGVLYTDIMRFDSNHPRLASRDRFILSKGHACAALYACLAHCDFFPVQELSSFGRDGSTLMTHVSHRVPGVEFSTGSLGHGLPFAVGTAFALKQSKSASRVFVLVGDGELDEGANWEAMIFAAHHNLDNLVLIVDWNNLQSLTTVEETLGLNPLDDKLLAFGWTVSTVDGHNHTALKRIFSREVQQPHAILAKTIKGKGVDFMENKVEWHYRNPGPELFKAAMSQLSQV